MRVEIMIFTILYLFVFSIFATIMIWTFNPMPRWVQTFYLWNVFILLLIIFMGKI